MCETVTPGSWGELVEALYADSWDDRLRRHRSPYAFRGMVRDRGLETSLLRLAGPTAVLEPPSIDQRLVNQFALSSLLPDPGLRLDDWLERHPELCRRLLVPAALKWEARDKLDQANVTERVLFPGLDGMGRWLRRHYSTRGPIREPGRSS